MNTTDYKAYQSKVARFLSINSVKPGCHSPLEDEAEPYFSWRPCECCSSGLGGDRENYQFATESGELFEAEICSDCVYYLAYGRLDDMTMLGMEEATGKDLPLKPEAQNNC